MIRWADKHPVWASLAAVFAGMAGLVAVFAAVVALGQISPWFVLLLPVLAVMAAVLLAVMIGHAVRREHAKAAHPPA